jgi:hypothetical protein
MATDSSVISPEQMEERMDVDLGVRLSRVTPNPEFFYRLRRRLVSQPAVVLEQKSDIIAMILVGLGLLAGVVILYVMRRFR